MHISGKSNLGEEPLDSRIAASFRSERKYHTWFYFLCLSTWAAWFTSTFGAPQRLRHRYGSVIDHHPAPLLASKIDNPLGVVIPSQPRNQNHHPSVARITSRGRWVWGEARSGVLKGFAGL